MLSIQTCFNGKLNLFDFSNTLCFSQLRVRKIVYRIRPGYCPCWEDVGRTGQPIPDVSRFHELAVSCMYHPPSLCASRYTYPPDLTEPRLRCACVSILQAESPPGRQRYSVRCGRSVPRLYVSQPQSLTSLFPARVSVSMSQAEPPPGCQCHSVRGGRR